MDKKKLLQESKVFCMFPWVHLNVTPRGNVYPCCSVDYTDPIGSVKDNSLQEIFNNDRMKTIRKNMLNGVESKECRFCYQHEITSPYSFRSYANEQFGKYFDEIVPQTEEDGFLNKFEMKYIDIRFSNICNFKCRTCGAEFSSRWATEDKKHSNGKYVITHADESGKLLDEVLTHLDHVDLLYFGGGEPLITDEHYILLEELIRRGKTATRLRYNTNCSNLKYKDKDILGLWDKFQDVEISASIDHYGERAEYIRNGTDWGEVESNLLSIRKNNKIRFAMNTVLSVFNYVTLYDFYSYMKDKGLFRPNDYYNTLYKSLHPSYYKSQILPKNLKEFGSKKNKKLIKKLKSEGFNSFTLIQEAIDFTESDHSWNNEKEEFLKNTKFRDKIRNEDFAKTFPELKSMLE